VVVEADRVCRVSSASILRRTPAAKEAIEVESAEVEAEVGGSALVPYTSGSLFSPSPVRPTSASSTKQRIQLLYIPPAIKRSFVLLTRYYSLPTSPPPSPNTASVLSFLHSFIQVNNSIPLSPIAPHADIEERLLDDTIRWVNVQGLRFADPRLALVPQSLQPIHQAAPLHSQPVHQAIRQSLPVDAIPGSPGTVLIPLQIENSSKKRKVRIRLAPLDAVSEAGEPPDAGELPDAVFESGEPPGTVSESTELPDASPIPLPENLPDDFKLLSLADNMAENSLKRGPLSPADSLDEFDDTRKELSRTPLAIGGMQSEVHQQKI